MMKIAKYIVFALFFFTLFAVAPQTHASSGQNRYLVYSSSSFVHKTFGPARHDFGYAFSADLTPFQLRIAKIFGVAIKPISKLHISALNVTADTVISQSSTKQKITVAILDTGSDVEDKNGHGAQIANIIKNSVGSNVGIVMYQVCDEDGDCYADDVAQGIYSAVADGARIINMSFGSDRPSDLIDDAIQKAVEHDVMMVAAAGNNGPFSDSVEYPANHSDVIAVGALSDSGSIAEWSSRGDVDAWEPGEYKTIAGTSVSAAYFTARNAKLLK